MGRRVLKPIPASSARETSELSHFDTFKNRVSCVCITMKRGPCQALGCLLWHDIVVFLYFSNIHVFQLKNDIRNTAITHIQIRRSGYYFDK